MRTTPPSERRHAVVLGASMAGLTTARALSGHFERVSLVERDDLPGAASTGAPEPRKGVPQGHHGHALLAAGGRVLERYFPGLMQELVEAGASEGDASGDFLWHQFGGWKLHAPSGLRGVVLTRPLLESRVRERVRALPNVTLLSRHELEEVLHDSTSGRVTGVRVTDVGEKRTRTLEADLVVDASGRGSQAPHWLEAWGYGKAREELIAGDIGYTSALFERRPEDVKGTIGCALLQQPPEGRRGGLALAVEGGRWLITLVGMLGDHAPAELEGFRDFAHSLPAETIHAVVKHREPQGPIRTFRIPGSRWRHFEQLRRFPEGFLVLGDAFCSFNPIYGQGMSVAINEALALDECLATGGEKLSARFFARATQLVETPWTIATGEDLRFPQVEGRRPPGTKLLHRYLERVHRAAGRDAVVLRRFFEVVHLVRKPTALLSPEIAFRALLNGGNHEGSVAPPSEAITGAT